MSFYIELTESRALHLHKHLIHCFSLRYTNQYNKHSIIILGLKPFSSYNFFTTGVLFIPIRYTCKGQNKG